MFKDCNMIKIIADADIIQYMHSKFIDVGGDHSSKKRIVFHGGSAYRNKPRFRNQIFNSIVDMSISQTGDLLNLGAKNEKWLLPPINTEELKPDYVFHGTDIPLFAHYPSNPKKKGTKVIQDTITKIGLNNHFRCVTSRVEWKKQIQRMSECDIYIELFLPVLGKRKYGEWGMTALEAASLGKIVVTNFFSLDRYKIEYGDCPFVVCNTAAFYNYIYYTVAGFTEHDTFRSNQIREGALDRKKGLQLIIEENRPRYPSLKWYIDILGLDFNSTIKKINEIPKLYKL